MEMNRCIWKAKVAYTLLFDCQNFAISRQNTFQLKEKQSEGIVPKIEPGDKAKKPDLQTVKT